jgi:hypothetical protein
MIEVTREQCPTPIRRVLLTSDNVASRNLTARVAYRKVFFFYERPDRGRPGGKWGGDMAITPENAREFAALLLELADQAEGQ